MSFGRVWKEKPMKLQRSENVLERVNSVLGLDTCRDPYALQGAYDCGYTRFEVQKRKIHWEKFNYQKVVIDVCRKVAFYVNRSHVLTELQEYSVALYCMRTHSSPTSPEPRCDWLFSSLTLIKLTVPGCHPFTCNDMRNMPASQFEKRFWINPSLFPGS